MHGNPLAIPTLLGGAALFWLGTALEHRVASKGRRICLWSGAVTLAIPGALFVLYYSHLFDSAAWYYNLRIVRYTELAGCGAGLIFGLVHAWWGPQTFGERLASPTALFVLLLIPFVKPILDPLDTTQLRDRFDGDVCLQSTFSTCGPASAVTLLRRFGQNVSEQQLASESLTSRGGTEIWYLSRALRRRGIESTVLIQSPGALMPSPAIAGVVLPGGAGHFIAVLDSNENQITLADPLKGKLVIPRHEIAGHYRFTGFFLVLSKTAAANAPGN